MRLLLAALVAIPCLAADWNPRAAADYLDAREQAWFAWPAANLAGGGKCVSCHTGLTYLVARPALRRALHETAPTEYETGLLDSLRARVSKRAPIDLYPKSKEPAELASVEAIFAALFLGTPDAFDRMWALQTPAGAWPWASLDLDPWEMPESVYFGASVAALALKSAPAAQHARPEAARLQQYLAREFAAQPLHNRLMALWAGAAPEAGRKSTLEELWRKQAADGGWTIEALGPFAKHEKATATTGTSAYATAFAAAALQKAGVSDPRLKRALGWLASHQNPKGYWDAVSMNKTYPAESMMAGFMRDAATAWAALALTTK
jgi:squalene-hopene/tetraprenyl-beta-curcumene cyclase